MGSFLELIKDLKIESSESSDLLGNILYDIENSYKELEAEMLSILYRVVKSSNRIHAVRISM